MNRPAGCRTSTSTKCCSARTFYKYTADADKKYLFDMERYMKRKPAIVKPDEPFEMYELTAMDLQ